MGRNLDALLGGSTRQRPSPASTTSERSEPTVNQPVTETPKESGSLASAAPRARANLNDSVGDGNVDNAAVPSAELTTANPTIAGASNITTATAAGTTTTSTSVNSDSAAELAIASGRNAGGGAAISSRGDVLNNEAPALATGERLLRRGVYQPRREFDQELLAELAESLKKQGMIQPILVRPFAGAFELIAGERRWRAAQLAGMGEIPAIVRELDDQSVASVALIENIQRKDLSPLEEAQALARLCDEFGMTHQAVADSVGRARASVSNLMRLLELHDEVKVMIDKGELEMGHARALLTLDTKDQVELAKRIAREGLSVRAAEKLAKAVKEGMTAIIKPPATVDPDIERLSRKLSDLLGAPVAIRHQKRGTGKLEISYNSVGELEGILAHIK